MSTKTFTVQLTVQFTALDAEDWDDERTVTGVIK